MATTEGEPPPKRPRGERGGKKTQKQKERRRQVIAGVVIPATDCPHQPNYGSQRSGPPEVEVVDLIPDPASSSSAAAPPAEPAPEAEGSAGDLPDLKVPDSKLIEAADPKLEAEPALSAVSTGGGEAASSLERLSQPIRESAKLQPGSFPTVASPSVRQEDLQVRIALDFHNVLDVASADGQSYEKIQPEAFAAIARFLLRSNKNFITIVSYIGERGFKSQGRRKSLREEVGKLNQRLASQGIERARLVRLLITSDPKKNELAKEAVSLHCDDKLSILDTCYQNEVIPIWFSRRANRWYQSCNNLEEVLERSGQLVLPKVYSHPILGEII